MNYDEFDYLNDSLAAWVVKFDPVGRLEGAHVGAVLNHLNERVLLIQDEYLPRFEAALHRQNAKNTTSKHWNNSHTAQLPFNVVVEDEELELEKVPGLLIVGQK